MKAKSAFLQDTRKHTQTHANTCKHMQTQAHPESSVRAAQRERSHSISRIKLGYYVFQVRTICSCWSPLNSGQILSSDTPATAPFGIQLYSLYSGLWEPRGRNGREERWLQNFKEHNNLVLFLFFCLRQHLTGHLLQPTAPQLHRQVAGLVWQGHVCLGVVCHPKGR